MKFRIGVTCPACQAGQLLGPLQCLRRRAAIGCRRCGEVLDTEIGLVAYLALAACAACWGALLLAAVLVTLMTGAWWQAAVTAAVLYVTVVLPGEMLHARGVRVRGERSS